jgi:hypothetical protein
MTIRIIVPAILGALALSSPSALAAVDITQPPPAQVNLHQYASDPAADECTRLKNLFDVELKNTHNVANEPRAKTLRAEGSALCATKDYGLGSAKLKAAVQGIMGFTPEM